MYQVRDGRGKDETRVPLGAHVNVGAYQGRIEIEFEGYSDGQLDQLGLG
jgi:hypothetical protein